jgi:hypothetical protein
MIAGMYLPMDLPGLSPGWWTRPATHPAQTGSLAELGGLPLAGGALTFAVPHPIIARRTWLWRAETGAVIEALGFAGRLSRPGRRDHHAAGAAGRLRAARHRRTLSRLHPARCVSGPSPGDPVQCAEGSSAASARAAAVMSESI